MNIDARVRERKFDLQQLTQIHRDPVEDMPDLQNFINAAVSFAVLVEAGAIFNAKSL